MLRWCHWRKQVTLFCATQRAKENNIRCTRLKSIPSGTLQALFFGSARHEQEVQTPKPQVLKLWQTTKANWAVCWTVSHCCKFVTMKIAPTKDNSSSQHCGLSVCVHALSLDKCTHVLCWEILVNELRKEGNLQGLKMRETLMHSHTYQNYRTKTDLQL